MAEEPHTRSPRRYRELAFRESAGVSVRLLRDSLDDEVFVDVRNHRGGDDLVLNPPKCDALSAFHHPYTVRGVRPPETRRRTRGPSTAGGMT